MKKHFKTKKKFPVGLKNENKNNIKGKRNNDDNDDGGGGEVVAVVLAPILSVFG